jgi:hypothetical protein
VTPTLFRRTTLALAAAELAASSTGLAHTQKKYDTCATATEIKIGNLAPTQARSRPTERSAILPAPSRLLKYPTPERPPSMR